MTPTPVETITYVPADTIVPSRPTDLEDVATVAVVVVAILLALWMIGEGIRARRAVHRVRKQARAIGVAAVGMALRIEKTR